MTESDLTTYSLAEAAERICGAGMKDPELWVRRRITDRTFPALKVGRTYRMTAEHIRKAIEALEVKQAEPAPIPGRLPPTARRRYY